MPSFTEILAFRRDAARRIIASGKALDREELVFAVVCHIPLETLETAVLHIIRDANPRALSARPPMQKGRR